MDKQNAVIKAVKSLKTGQFKATAIKVELEAELGRGNGRSESCEECYEGYNECYECDGTAERMCGDCNGTGRQTVEGQSIICNTCEGGGEVGCEYCETGHVICDSCDGDYRYDDNDGAWGDVTVCHTFIMERLAKLGLAEFKPNNWVRLAHGQETRWHVKEPLKYAEFYRDGSVDSEFTFTLSIKNPKTVFLLPKVIDIFNQLGEAVGNGISVRGAGMHMALLNDPKCLYPVGTPLPQIKRFENFSKSMMLLLPALYFLGTGNEVSRGLEYRRPEIGYDSHRAAVDYRGGALEFRVFDTCYDSPEQILDNIVVMSKCMRYWTNVYKPSGLAKITKEVRFGNDMNQDLGRFYASAEHIDLLNAGLRKLKPSYFSIRDIKQQRKFRVDKRTLVSKLKEQERQAAASYKEWENRFDWTMRAWRHKYLADYIESESVPDPEQAERVMAEIEQRAEQAWRERAGTKKTPQQHIDEAVAQYQQSIRGRYILAE